MPISVKHFWRVFGASFDLRFITLFFLVVIIGFFLVVVIGFIARID